jgi:hypothetical protein
MCGFGTFRNASSLQVTVNGSGWLKEEWKEEEEEGEVVEVEEEAEGRGCCVNVTLRVAGVRDEGPDKFERTEDAKSTTFSSSL